MTTFGNKEPWMEPMNKFLVGNRADFKNFVDQICDIPATHPAPVPTPSYTTPLQILGRLPATSREGFPSLPFLIDQARCFASLIRIWLEVVPERLSELEEIDASLARFHQLALQLSERTEDCLDDAEQAERPNGDLEVKWEQLLDSMERAVTFYGESSSSSKPGTPAPETSASGTAKSVSISAGHRGSIGFFAPRPAMPRRSTDYTREEEDTPPSSSSATWDQSRIPFSIPRWSDARDSNGSSKNSSTYSLKYSESSKGQVQARRASVTKETSSKYRFFDFVPAPSRRKAKERDHSQHDSHEDLPDEV